jgi:hypothetical protein
VNTLEILEHSDETFAAFIKSASDAELRELYNVARSREGGMNLRDSEIAFAIEDEQEARAAAAIA